jgi:hypothetical protein
VKRWEAIGKSREVRMFFGTIANGIRRPVLLALGWAAISLQIGCGDGRVRVTGSVTFGGKPVEEGTIAFEPANGQGPSTGGPITDGVYDLTGDARATAGEKIVRIIASSKTGRKIPVPPPAPPGTMIEERIQGIPKQYNDQSSLRVEITPGKDNTHNFDLKPAPTTR